MELFKKMNIQNKNLLFFEIQISGSDNQEGTR